MRIFTEDELREYDGSNGIVYVAYSGKVYDVSSSYHWREAVHHIRHRAGRDLSNAMGQAPHSPDILQKFPVVGELARSDEYAGDDHPRASQF